MSVILLLIALSVIVAGSFLGAFIWAMKSGQYEDTFSPSVRILFDGKKKKKKDNHEEQSISNNHNQEQ